MSKPESQSNPKGNDRSGRLTRYSAYLYLAMALLIVAVATFSIFALNRSIEPPADYSVPEFSFDLPSPTPGVSEPSTPSEGTDSEGNLPSGGSIPLPPDDTPVLGEQSGVEDTNSSDTPSTPPASNGGEPEGGSSGPRYASPIADGEVLKACALDKLVFSATMKDYRVHTGLDLASPLGAEVHCYTDGTVNAVQDDPFYGKVVTVQHAYGLVTVYANLAPELAEGIQVGTELSAGDCIGYVGATAISETADEPHLHFEMVLNGERIDPEKELFH